MLLMRQAMSSGYINEDIITSLSESKAYDELMEVIGGITYVYFNELTEDRTETSYRSCMMTLLTETYSSLRSLAEQIKNCDSLLVGSIGRLISNLNFLIIDLLKQDDFADHPIKTQLEKTLSWNIYLPTWFVHHSEPFQDSFSFRTLNESIAKTGVLLFKEGHYNLVLDCIKATHSIAKETLNKIQESRGFTEPRVMLRACYLGVLALKSSQQGILTEVRKSVVEFEQLYVEKFPVLPNPVNPEETRLYLECARWRDEIANRLNYDPPINADATTMILEWGVDEEDIDSFMIEMLNWIQ